MLISATTSGSRLLPDSKRSRTRSKSGAGFCWPSSSQNAAQSPANLPSLCNSLWSEPDRLEWNSRGRSPKFAVMPWPTISVPLIRGRLTFIFSKAARACFRLYPEDLSQSALEQLQRLGVEVHTSTMVTNVEPGLISMGQTRMKADVIVWAAGVAASSLGKKLGTPVDRAGRVLVQPDLSIADHPEVFVVGDLAALKDASGKMLPGVAPVAILEGRYVAKLIRQEILQNGSRSGISLRHDFRQPFHYRDKGSLATIGRAAAVAEIGKIHISGYIAWLAWLFIHIFFLIGFQNRVLVLIQWASSYFTYERGARLITGSTTLPGWNGFISPGYMTKVPKRQEIPAATRK